MTTRILSWDWRGQPDLDQLGKAIHDLSGGRLSLHQVDTSGDEYAIVVSDEPLNKEQVTAVWDAQFDEEDR